MKISILYFISREKQGDKKLQSDSSQEKTCGKKIFGIKFEQLNIISSILDTKFKQISKDGKKH